MLDSVYDAVSAPYLDGVDDGIIKWKNVISLCINRWLLIEISLDILSWPQNIIEKDDFRNHA